MQHHLPRSRRRRRLALAVALTALLGACGVEGGDAIDAASPTTSTTSAPADTSVDETSDDPTDAPALDGSVDSMAEIYRELGFTEDEATCLAEGIDELLGAGGTGSQADVIEVFNECEIPLERMGEIGAGLGGSEDEVFRNSLEAGFRAGGLSDEQAGCLTDAYLDEFGIDPMAAQDPTALQPLFEACDVDPTDFGG